MRLDWRAWLGLPHEIGADPRDGSAACCLVMTTIILQDKGFNTPPIDDWLVAAKAGNYAEILYQLEKCIEPITTPEMYAFTIFRNGRSGLGVGIVIESNTLLLVHHRKGVITLPLDRLRLMRYNRLRQ